MNANRVKRNQMLGEKVIKALNSRNIEAFYADSKEDALVFNRIVSLKSSFVLPKKD